MISALATGCIHLGHPLVAGASWIGRVGLLFAEALFWITAGWWQRHPLRFAAVVRQLADVGLGALPLTALFGAAIGVVMGIQLVSLLAMADILTAFIDGFTSVLMREVVPLLTGILVATRSGTALVAALARMDARKEVDALVGMGIEPVRYLVAPVLLAFVVAVPILNLAMVAVVLLMLSAYVDLASGFTWQLVLTIAVDVVTVGDTVVCVLKGMIFATIMSTVSAAYGLAIVGGRRDIGPRLTRATVVVLGLILVSNAIVTILSS